MSQPSKAPASDSFAAHAAQAPKKTAKTRLAPSPTGALHLGNARTFLINWLLARQNGWQISLRIDDLDGPRVKPGADQQAIEDLTWLGIDWDEGPTYQTPRIRRYHTMAMDLLERKLAYPCVCTRREVEEAASAPHGDDGASIYPGTCRGKFAALHAARADSGREPAIRFAATNEVVRFQDIFAGELSYDAAQDIGDFVILKNDGTAAYQLAVVIDDADAQITHVVRGDDLLSSAARQILLYRSLGWENQIPAYMHLPLVVGQDGRRLAKRHGDTRLSHYRDEGVPASRILSLLAKWLNVPPTLEPKTASDLLGAFDIRRLPRERIVFSADDDTFLRRGIA